MSGKQPLKFACRERFCPSPAARVFFQAWRDWHSCLMVKIFSPVNTATNIENLKKTEMTATSGLFFLVEYLLEFAPNH